VVIPSEIDAALFTVPGLPARMVAGPMGHGSPHSASMSGNPVSAMARRALEEARLAVVHGRRCAAATDGGEKAGSKPVAILAGSTGVI
jgi:hypothetical protein